MDTEPKESLLRQITDAFGNRKYFLMSAAVTFFLMLAALVTASNHLNSVRVHAAEVKRKAALSARNRLKLLGYGKDNHNMRISVPHILLPGAGGSTNSEEQVRLTWCRHPDCVWVEEYLKGKLEPAVKPCEDFYSHVCSPKWRATNLPFSQRSYREISIGSSIQNLAGYFNYTTGKHFPGELQDKFMSQVSSLFMDCIIEYKGRNEKESLLDIIRQFRLTDYNASSNLSTLVGFLDREMRLFPLVKVALMPKTYSVQVTPSTTLLKRFHLSFETKTLEDYVHTVARALGLLNPNANVRKYAEDIAALEVNLESAYTGLRRSNSSHEDSLSPRQEVSSHTWSWDVYFRTVLRDRRDMNYSAISPKPPDLLTKLSRLVDKTEPETVIQYLRYRFLVFAAPFLSEDFGFLLPLGYGSHQENVNERLQACAHSVEGIYPYAMRFFVSSANKETMPSHTWTEHMNAIEELVTVCKNVLKAHLQSKAWMTPGETNTAMKRIDTLKVVLDYDINSELDTILHYYSRMVVPLRSNSPLQTFITLQHSSSELYWATDDNTLDLDTRVAESSLVPGYQYVQHSHVLYISPATLGFLGNIHRSTMFLIPSVLPFVLLGLHTPLYAPGAEYLDRQTNKLITENRLCLFEKYYAGLTDVLKEDVAVDMEMHNFVEYNSVVKVLYNVFLIYKNLTTVLTKGVGGNKAENATDFSMDQLFLTTWAATQCDATTSAQEKRLIQYNVVPPRFRVDISLHNFEMFPSIFACPKDSPMNPWNKCRQL